MSILGSLRTLNQSRPSRGSLSEAVSTDRGERSQHLKSGGCLGRRTLVDYFLSGKQFGPLEEPMGLGRTCPVAHHYPG